MGALGRQGLWELALESLRALRQKHDAEAGLPPREMGLLGHRGRSGDGRGGFTSGALRMN